MAKQALVDLSKNDQLKDVKIGNKIIDYVLEKELNINSKKLIPIDIGIFTYGLKGKRDKIQTIYYENKTDKIFELDSTNKIPSEIK